LSYRVMVKLALLNARVSEAAFLVPRLDHSLPAQDSQSVRVVTEAGKFPVLKSAPSDAGCGTEEDDMAKRVPTCM
jgi:hypothetical protein